MVGVVVLGESVGEFVGESVGLDEEGVILGLSDGDVDG